MEAGEANVQDMAAQKNFQQILAPFPGIVTRRNTDVGALINAGAGTNVANNQELFHLARTDILRVDIQVPQVYSADVALDTPAYLVLEQFPGERFQGKVAHVAGAIDSATRTLLTEVQVKNEDGRLLPGAFSQVHLILPIKNPASTIPINAVLFRSQGTQVGVVTADNVVHLHDHRHWPRLWNERRSHQGDHAPGPHHPESFRLAGGRRRRAGAGSPCR